VIDVAWCIGCTLCIKACPVDCIVGAPKQMHTVIPELCTGCELCLPVCPVDCIALVTATGDRTGWRAWSSQQADVARRRYAVHRARLPIEGGESVEEDALRADDEARANSAEVAPSSAGDVLAERRDAIVAAALARARAGRSAP
jgi:electron transport complex protein RnfB